MSLGTPPGSPGSLSRLTALQSLGDSPGSLRGFQHQRTPSLGDSWDHGCSEAGVLGTNNEDHFTAQQELPYGNWEKNEEGWDAFFRQIETGSPTNGFLDFSQ